MQKFSLVDMAKSLTTTDLHKNCSAIILSNKLNFRPLEFLIALNF